MADLIHPAHPAANLCLPAHDNAPADTAPALPAANAAEIRPAPRTAADSRTAILAAMAADVDAARSAASCWCGRRPSWLGRYRPDPGADEVGEERDCPRHGETSDARESRETRRCECGEEDTLDAGLWVTAGTHRYWLCRACSTCSGCHRRVEVVDGDLCDPCSSARDEAQDAREREREWGWLNDSTNDHTRY